MNENTYTPHVSASGIFAGVVTAMLMALAANIILGFWSGAWTPGPSETFASVLAVQSFELAIVTASVLLMSLVVLTPVFLATAALGLWRVPHAINAGLVGGTVLFAIAVMRLPQLAVEHLLPMALTQFSTAIAACLAFRHTSLKSRNS